MKPNICTCYIILALCSLLAGCNDDVFVDRINDIEDIEIVIDGNGGSHTITLPKEELKGVSFFTYSAPFAITTYYDALGEQVYPGTIDDVAMLAFWSPRFRIEFYLNGNEVEIKALDNSYDHVVAVTIWLNYGYESKEINLSVTPGKPMTLGSFGYDILRPEYGTTTLQVARTLYKNSTSTNATFAVYPFKIASSRVATALDNEYSWADGLSFEIPVPVFENGEWLDISESTALATLGYASDYYSLNTDPEVKTSVEIPPHSSAIITLYVTYATLNVAFLGDLSLPNSQQMYGISGRCQFYQPIDYKLDVICDD